MFQEELTKVLDQREKEVEMVGKLSGDILLKGEKLRGIDEETKRIEDMIEKKREATNLVASAIIHAESAADSLVLTTMQGGER